MSVETPVQIRWLDPETIRPGKNPRKFFSQEALLALMGNIAEVGQKVPVVVRPISDDQDPNIKWELIAGHRRHRAICKLHLPKIKAVIEDISDPKEIYLYSVVENASREGYTIQEIVEIIAELIYVHDCTREKIANIFGKSVSWVHSYSKLMGLEPSLLARMNPETPDAQRVRLTDALLVVDLPMENQALALEDMQSNHPLVKQEKARRLRAATLTQERGRTGKPSDHYKRLMTALNAIEASLTVWLGTDDLASLFEHRSPADRKLALNKMLGISKKAAGFHEKLQALVKKK